MCVIDPLPWRGYRCGCTLQFLRLARFFHLCNPSETTTTRYAPAATDTINDPLGDPGFGADIHTHMQTEAPLSLLTTTTTTAAAAATAYFSLSVCVETVMAERESAYVGSPKHLPAKPQPSSSSTNPSAVGTYYTQRNTIAFAVRTGAFLTLIKAGIFESCLWRAGGFFSH